eukprot:CAMPEP_0170556898 /NCGR_PEP_ID=MMETSP0211-20121228/19040_1 /TAXON_ID=311385 /ORGANISM="Pseudokeronopsis sp., Strain OXSARD2" /LENGTH=70 /DNA_ID=CAMNT_0010867503 /DNA_START=947 /DNA_END=1159 /DNA_ORIENTATION=-
MNLGPSNMQFNQQWVGQQFGQQQFAQQQFGFQGFQQPQFQQQTWSAPNLAGGNFGQSNQMPPFNSGFSQF